MNLSARHLAWVVCVALALFSAFAFGQTPTANRQTTAASGRFSISYHSTNFNQAFLLDTANGNVWRLTTISLVARENSTQEEQNPVKYQSFERVSVEGLYQSAAEKKAIRDAPLREITDKVSSKLKWSPEKASLLRSIDLPSKNELRAVARQSESPIAFLLALNERWPHLKELPTEDKLLAIADRFPEIAVEFPQLFALVLK